MGSEDGYLHFYDSRSRYPLAQSCLDDQCPIVSILHCQKTKLVYILLEVGIVYAVNDDISVELSSAAEHSVFIKLNVIGMYQVNNNTTSCFAIVPNTNSIHELWVGKSDSIIVLNAKTFKPISKLNISGENSSCITHITVAIVESDTEPSYDKITINSVFSAFYQGQIVTQWNIRSKKIVAMLNINDFVKGLSMHTYFKKLNINHAILQMQIVLYLQYM